MSKLRVVPGGVGGATYDIVTGAPTPSRGLSPANAFCTPSEVKRCNNLAAAGSAVRVRYSQFTSVVPPVRSRAVNCNWPRNSPLLGTGTDAPAPATYHSKPAALF